MGKKNKRILIVIGSLNLGGTEKYLLTVLPKLLADYDINVYTTSFAGTLLKDFESAGIKVLYSRKACNKSNIKILKALCLIGNLIRAARFMSSSNYDAIHFFLPGAYLLGGCAALLAGQKNLLMSRRSQNNYQAKHPIMAKIERYLHSKMRFVLANSKRVKEQLLEEGVDKNRLRLIYNGVDVNRFNIEPDMSFKTALGIKKDAFVFSIIANFYQYKGHEDLFHALSRIREKLPDRWVLLCVGRDAGEKNKLAQLAKQLDLKKHIHFLNETSDIAKIIAITDLGISASHEEGFSNAVLEMMAGGKPMIVTDVGGNAEAVLDNETGIVVPPKDVNAFSKAIVKLLGNQDKMREFGERAKTRLLSEFSLEKCVNQNKLLYEEVTDTYKL